MPLTVLFLLGFGPSGFADRKVSPGQSDYQAAQPPTGHQPAINDMQNAIDTARDMQGLITQGCT